ncbi:phosphohydrolase [[Acidovorax] ebreus]|uniref:phosphohydrolase n=1 Tax=[Acidovorax] ebreus TaxID=721785 RepID=UPI00204F17B4|nr:phosphohydrolase [[Acidovorax] ebreus]
MTPEAARAWVRLPSGRRLDLINPDPSAWLDSDLALRLARTYRWGGESSWPLPLSVAQHSLLVLALRRQWSDTPLTPSDALLELLHDAEEGFLGFDCISPLKDVLGLSFRAVSSRLMAAVSERYELRAWSSAAHAVHKRADSVAAASEAVHCIGWPVHEVRDVLSIVHPVLDVDPLADIYGCRPWEPWAADVAAERFLDVLESLRAAVHGQIKAQA